MSRLIWAPEAILDVQRLYRFLALNNLEAAKRAVKTIRSIVKIIASQPEMGRPTEIADFREWLVDFGDSGHVVL